MEPVNAISTPMNYDLLVSFSDLQKFAALAQGHSPQDLFAILSAYYEFVGEIIESAGGKVVKFIGDAVLITFPENLVDAGVVALKRLKEEGDNWLRDRKLSSKHVIKAHFGPVCCGLIGTNQEKRFDIFGQTVNTAALLESHGFAITPQVFRKLTPDTRKLFKKHTPPITYIPVEESHKR